MAFRLGWPTEFGVVTQEFGENPENYERFGLPGHEGVDFKAPMGSKIFACADGIVSDVRLDGNTNPDKKPYGNQVRIRHDTSEGDFTTVYAHLQSVSVSVGDRVQRGMEIGKANDTGNSFGSHLHLTLLKVGATANGETNFPRNIMNPTPFLDPFTGEFVEVASDGLRFVKDVTIRDGMMILPSFEFLKTWRVRNSGNTFWGEGYTLDYLSGEKMDGEPIDLSTTAPGMSVDISVTLKSPKKSGLHRSVWQAKNPEGKPFGQIIWVEVNVTS